MAALGGTTVISPIRPSDSNDTYPSHEAAYGKGGFRSVDSIAERDAIPAPRREVGMLVAVTGDSTFAWDGSAWIEALLTPEQVQALVDTKAALNHQHVEADITDLDKYTQAETQQQIQAALNHQHVEADITDLDKYTQAETQQQIQAAIDAATVLFPAGLLLDWPSNSPPTGALTRNGALVEVADFPKLYDAIGTAYNEVGDTDPDFFRLPDDRDKYSIGAGGSLNVGDEAGANTVDLSHDHDVVIPGDGGALSVGDGGDSGTYTTDQALGNHDNRPASRAYLPIIVADPAAFVGGVAGGSGAVIDDSVTAFDKAWSSEKIAQEIANGGETEFFGLTDTPSDDAGKTDRPVLASGGGLMQFDDGLMQMAGTITQNHTIPDGMRGLSLSPFIPAGVTVTVEGSGAWHVLGEITNG